MLQKTKFRTLGPFYKPFSPGFEVTWPVLKLSGLDLKQSNSSIRLKSHNLSIFHTLWSSNVYIYTVHVVFPTLLALSLGSPKLIP